jgi:hypothetical protein
VVIGVLSYSNIFRPGETFAWRKAGLAALPVAHHLRQVMIKRL